MVDEHGDIIVDNIFLVHKSLLREGMGEGTTLASMIRVVRHGECRNTHHWLDRAYMNGVFVEVGVTWTMTVDIFPCLHRVEM